MAVVRSPGAARCSSLLSRSSHEENHEPGLNASPAIPTGCNFIYCSFISEVIQAALDCGLSEVAEFTIAAYREFGNAAEGNDLSDLAGKDLRTLLGL